MSIVFTLEAMSEEESESAVWAWEWKEKSENGVASSLANKAAKDPVVGDGRAYTNQTSP